MSLSQYHGVCFMNRFVSASLFLAAIGLAALRADRRSGSWCTSPLRRVRHGLCVPTDCASTTVVAAPAAPVYEERKVTRYKHVTKERDVVVTVCKLVNREEKYDYTVQVPVTKTEKRTQTVNVAQMKEVEYKYTVMVPHTVAEKRTVIECIPSYKDVEFTYTVCVPVTTKSIVKQTYMQRQTKMVPCETTVCRMVRETCVDECGRCHTVCRPVTEVVQSTRCVVECVPVTRDVEVCNVSYNHEQRKGVRRVCEIQRVEKVIDVNVVRCSPEERVGKRTVCEYVPTVQEYTVNVCSYVTEKRVGTRVICDRVEEKVARKVHVHRMRSLRRSRPRPRHHRLRERLRHRLRPWPSLRRSLPSLRPRLPLRSTDFLVCSREPRPARDAALSFGIAPLSRI